MGPSAAPIIAIDAASFSSNPSREARLNVKNIPNCAAAPKIISFGLDNSGPKSIIAPMPINSNNGKSSFAIPASKSTSSAPTSSPCVIAPDNGKFTSIAPNPSGNKSVGSIFFLIAKKIRTAPITYITHCCHVTLSTFPKSSAIYFLLFLIVKQKKDFIGKSAQILRCLSDKVLPFDFRADKLMPCYDAWKTNRCSPTTPFNLFDCY